MWCRQSACGRERSAGVVASRSTLPFTWRPQAQACLAGADPVGWAATLGLGMPLAPRRNILWSTLMALLAMLQLQACGRQETEWRRVRAEDSPAAYEDYLRRNPGGTHGAEAQERLRALREEREWERAVRLDAPEAFQQYLGAYPEGRFAAEARERLADFLLAQAPSGVPEDHPAAAHAAPPRKAEVVAAAPPSPRQERTVEPAPEKPAAVVTAAPQSARRPAGGSAQPARITAAATRTRSTVPAAARRAGAEARRPATAGSAHRLQLGAFAAGEGAARGAWQKLQRAHRDLIGGLTPHIDTVTRNGRTLWRLRAGPVDARRATELCAALRARGAACVVATP